MISRSLVPVAFKWKPKWLLRFHFIHFFYIIHYTSLFLSLFNTVCQETIT